MSARVPDRRLSRGVRVDVGGLGPQRAHGGLVAVAEVAAQLKVDLAHIEILPPADQVSGSKPIADLGRRLEAESARAARLNALAESVIGLLRYGRPGE